MAVMGHLFFFCHAGKPKVPRGSQEAAGARGRSDSLQVLIDFDSTPKSISPSA